MKFLLLFIGILFSTSTFSNDVYMSVASKHINSKYNYNENNLGLTITKNTLSYRYVSIGFYKNSLERNSFYTSAGFEINKHLSFEGGLISGYKDTPIILGIFVYKIDNLRIIVIPPSEKSPLTIGLQIKLNNH